MNIVNLWAGPAVSGGVLRRVSGTLTFGPGQMGQWIPIQIINDSVFGEPDEEIHLALWGASGLALADDFAVGRIIDDDQIR